MDRIGKLGQFQPGSLKRSGELAGWRLRGRTHMARRRCAGDIPAPEGSDSMKATLPGGGGRTERGEPVRR
jgi:hypothetical protein